MKIKTIIVDDEALARGRLRQLLETETDIEIVSECSHGGEAVAAIKKESPQLVFLDVQMPELDGFGVLEKIRGEAMPVVVFVTAHDKFALKAFEVHAIDYLLKPFDKERFQAALKKARTHLKQSESSGLNERLSALLADLKPEARHPDRIAVKVSGRVLLVRTAEIDWVEAADNYLSLHIGSEAHLLRETMTGLEGRLDPKQFIRISRSTMVNVERIRELQPMFHGDYVVILRDGTKLNLSRGYRDKLQQLGLT
jgi:two-component system LytT family response regulator